MVGVHICSLSVSARKALHGCVCVCVVIAAGGVQWEWPGGYNLRPSVTGDKLAGLCLTCHEPADH